MACCNSRQRVRKPIFCKSCGGGASRSHIPCDVGDWNQLRREYCGVQIVFEPKPSPSFADTRLRIIHSHSFEKCFYSRFPAITGCHISSHSTGPCTGWYRRCATPAHENNSIRLWAYRSAPIKLTSIWRCIGICPPDSGTGSGNTFRRTISGTVLCEMLSSHASSAQLIYDGGRSGAFIYSPNKHPWPEGRCAVKGRAAV